MENTKIENLYIVGWGLGGGFGGIRDYEVIEAESQDQADEWVYENACDYYEGYVGMYGLRGVDDIMCQDDIEDEDEAEEIFNEERESWLDYIAVPYSKEFESKISGNHYYNPYKHITDQ